MSIKTNALIVSVTINQPTKARTNRTVSDDVMAKHNASADAGRLVNNLYPKRVMEPIDKAVSRARSFIRQDTYMWNRNEFMLPANRFMEFAERAGKLELQFEQAVTAFLNNWSNVMLESQRDLGAMFDSSAYPSLEQIKQQFCLKFHYRQVTDENDFRVQMQEEELEELRKLTAANIRSQYEGLTKAPVEAVVEAMQKLFLKLNEPPREVTDEHGAVVDMKPAIFRDSTVNNILDEAQKIIDFGDTVLPTAFIDFARRVRSELPTAAQIRNSDGLKIDVRNKLMAWVDEAKQLIGQTPPVGETDLSGVELDADDEMEVMTEYSQDPTEFAPLEPDPSRDLMKELDNMFEDDFA